MGSGNIISEIHAMDETQEKGARQEKADFFTAIAYLSLIPVGWGIIVVLIGLYGAISSPSGGLSQLFTMILGVILAAIGLLAHFYFKNQAKKWSGPEPGMWELG